MTRSDTLYRMRVSNAGFFIEALGGKVPPFRWREHSLAGATKRASGNEYRLYDDLCFDLAVMVLKLTSKKAAAFFDLTGEPRSINTRYNPDSLRDTFRNYAKALGKTTPRKGEERITLDFERLTALFAEAYGPIRRKLGWGDPLPTDYHYSITPDVIAAAGETACRDYLEQIGALFQYIFPDVYGKLEAKLASDYPGELKEVRKALKQSKSRNHLSSLSLADIRGETMVCIANHHKQRLRLEAWKFLALMDKPDSTKMIARLERTDYREKSSSFLFCDRTTGDVHAVFKPKHSTIHVVCEREEDKVPDEIAEFVIDPDFALCMYMLLSRLRRDKEEFTRLWEEANIQATYDPFKDKFNLEEDLL